MLWVIQENIHLEGKFQELIDNIERFGDRVELVKVVPFVGDIEPDVQPEEDEKVICFGSYSMRHFAQKKGWNPGVYDIEWFPYQSLIGCLGDSVLNRKAEIGKFGEIDPQFDEFFIRPTHDGKQFAGAIKTATELKEWQHRVVNLGLKDNGTTLTGETEVLYAPIQKIQTEHRFFVVNGRVVTGSQYKLGNRVVYSNSDHLWPIAQTFVDKLNEYIKQPCVIDIARLHEGYKVIELNTLNCSGFYDCDMQKLVYCLKEYIEGT